MKQNKLFIIIGATFMSLNLLAFFTSLYFDSNSEYNNNYNKKSTDVTLTNLTNLINFPIYNVCIFIFATTKNKDHFYETEQVHKTWASPTNNNNIWFIFNEFEKLTKFNIKNICNSKKYSSIYDNCIFVPDSYSTTINPRPVQVKKPLGKKWFDLFKYIDKPINPLHLHMKKNCKSFMKIDTDAYAMPNKLNSMFGCMDGLNKKWFVGPAWGKFPFCKQRHGKKIQIPFASGFAKAISNSLNNFMFDKTNNTIEFVRNQLKKYKYNEKTDPIINKIKLNNSKSIFEHCWEYYFEPITTNITGTDTNVNAIKVSINTDASVTSNTQNNLNKSLLTKKTKLISNPCYSGGDDGVISHCLLGLFKLDRLDNILTTAQSVFVSTDASNLGVLKNYWLLENIKTNVFKNGHLKNYVWHKVNAKDMQLIHQWYINESTNPESIYYDELNYRYESKSSIKQYQQNKNIPIMAQNHWDILGDSKCAI